MSYYSSSEDLITLARAKKQFQSFNSANDAVLQSCVTAASQAFQRYCGRYFVVKNFDELADGQGTYNLLLSQYPLVRIDRISWNRQAVMTIRNENQAYSRASWRLDGIQGEHTATSLNLTKVLDGVQTQDTLDLEDYQSIADLATAINAIGSGWVAYPLPVWSENPCTDLRSPQGAMNARLANSYVYDWVIPMWDFNQNEDIGEVVSWSRFQRGYRNYRIQYIAGFADDEGATEIPEDIQQTVAEIAASAFLNIGLNPNLQSETLQDYSYTRAIPQAFENLSLIGKETVRAYKSLKAPRFNVWGD
jgi:hypothetical protein